MRLANRDTRPAPVGAEQPLTGVRSVHGGGLNPNRHVLSWSRAAQPAIAGSAPRQQRPAHALETRQKTRLGPDHKWSVASLSPCDTEGQSTTMTQMISLQRCQPRRQLPIATSVTARCSRRTSLACVTSCSATTPGSATLSAIVTSFAETTAAGCGFAGTAWTETGRVRERGTGFAVLL